MFVLLLLSFHEHLVYLTLSLVSVSSSIVDCYFFTFVRPPCPAAGIVNDILRCSTRVTHCSDWFSSPSLLFASVELFNPSLNVLFYSDSFFSRPEIFIPCHLMFSVFLFNFVLLPSAAVGGICDVVHLISLALFFFKLVFLPSSVVSEICRVVHRMLFTVLFFRFVLLPSTLVGALCAHSLLIFFSDSFFSPPLLLVASVACFILHCC